MKSYVGRKPELALVGRCLEARATGGPGLILVAGEPGVGKTRFIAEVSNRARAAGWLAIVGHAHDTEGTPGYLPFIEAIQGLISAISSEQFGSLLASAPEIAGLIPGLRARVSNGSQFPAGAEDQRYRLFDAVSEVFLRASAETESAGLMLCLDDLHWADRPTLLAFLHLARKINGARLLVLATYRSVEMDDRSPLFSVLADLRRERLAENMTLSPLSFEETAELARAENGGDHLPPKVVEALFDRTEGNPFFIEEVMRQLRGVGHDLSKVETLGDDWSVPEGVRQVIGHRLVRLGDEVVRLIEAAAVLGGDFGFDVLREVAELPEEIAIVALDKAILAGMLREDGTNYAFSHPIIRETAYRRLGGPRRQRLHLRAAQAIEAATTAGMDIPINRLAAHCRLAGRLADPEMTIGYLLRAGEAARVTLAFEESVAHWEAALLLLERSGADAKRRVKLLVDLAELMQQASIEQEKIIVYLEKAIELEEALGNYSSAVTLHGRLGLQLSIPRATTDLNRAKRLYETAEALISPTIDELSIGTLKASKAFTAGIELRFDDAISEVRVALEIAERRGIPMVAWFGIYADNLAALGKIDEALSLRDRLWQIAQRSQLGFASWWAASWGTFGLCTYLADPVDAIEGCERDFAAPYTARRTLVPNAVVAYILSGRLDQAEELLRRIGRMVSVDDWLFEYWKTDASGEVESMLEHQIETAHHTGEGWLGFYSRFFLGQSQMQRGAYASAEVTLQDLLATATGTGYLPMELQIRIRLALLYAAWARPDEAVPHLKRSREIADDGTNWRGVEGRLLLAEAAVLSCKTRQGEALIGRAIDVLRRYSLVWDEAEALHIWGRVLGAGHRSQRFGAVKKLDDSMALYRDHGAGRRWIDQVEQDKRRLLGVGPKQEYPDGLTQREVEVLRLLARGDSSNEIGRDLVLSVRTVERHIANIYLKTDTHGRAQATGYAIANRLA